MDAIEHIENYLEEQIKARRELLTQMVGNLYPKIVSEEISKLQKALNALRYY